MMSGSGKQHNISKITKILNDCLFLNNFIFVVRVLLATDKYLYI